MIIVEGSDKVGKTTLCKALCEVSKGRRLYRHLGLLPDAFDCFESYVAMIGRHFVYDRFHLSELVYSKVLGRSSNLTIEKATLLEGVLRLNAAFIIVVTCDDCELNNRLKTMSDDLMSKDVILKANQRFKTIGQYWDVNVHIKCTNAKPFPLEDLDYILSEYEDHVAKVTSILESYRNSRPTLAL